MNFEKKLGNFIFPKNHTIDSSSCGKNSTLAFLKLFLYSNFKNFGGHWKIFPHLIFSENMSFFGGTIDVCTRWVFEKKSWPTSNLQNLKLLSFLQISIFFGTDVKLFGYCNYTNFHNYLNLPQIKICSAFLAKLRLFWNIHNDKKKFVKFWKKSWATSFFPKIRLLTRQVVEKIPHWNFWSCFHTPTSKTLADIEKFSHTSFFLKICHFLVEPLMFVPDGFLKKKVGQLLTSKTWNFYHFSR